MQLYYIHHHGGNKRNPLRSSSFECPSSSAFRLSPSIFLSRSLTGPLQPPGLQKKCSAAHPLLRTFERQRLVSGRGRFFLLHVQQNHQLKKQQEPRPSPYPLTVLQTQPSSHLSCFKALLRGRLTQPGFRHRSAYTDILTYPAVSLILVWSEFPLRRPAPSSHIHQSPKNQQQKPPLSYVPCSKLQQQRHKLS